jgi:hypothetical protein
VFQSRFNLFEDFKDRDQVYGIGYTNVRQVTLKFTLGILHDEAVRLNTNAGLGVSTLQDPPATAGKPSKNLRAGTLREERIFCAKATRFIC